MTAVERDVPLAKLTTIGTGGPARALARPRSIDELVSALRQARDEGLHVLAIGLGSNLLAADEGVDALVVRLEGELASVAVRDEALEAGAGATNAVCLHHARAAGLGDRVRVRYPGHCRGGVFMNAGAYGSDWAEAARPCPRRLCRRRGLANAGAARPLYRHSALALGRGRRTRRVPARASSPRGRQGEGRDLVARRKGTQPTNKRTFGSVFKNPPGEVGAGRMLELCGLKGHRIGGAVVSPKHANFIENAGGATTADCLALMSEARRRAREEFGVELEREVVFARPPRTPRLT